MNAKERLRQYLEQRREFGETELVLDSMTVDEVMSLLGAPGGEPTAPEPSSRSTMAAEPAPRAHVRETAESQSSDWRATLTALGGAPTPKAPSPPPPDVRGPTPLPATAGQAPTPPTPRTPPVNESETSATPVVPLEQMPTGLIVGTPAHELFEGPSPWASLGDIAAAVDVCRKCRLYETAKRAVPGEGNPNADLVCVGEAPGANEDEQGRPFVGAAGQLLTKILAAINLQREDVFICNVLKHRPPGNRNPELDEVQACSPYLVRQIELLRPRVIVAFGTFAAQTLLQTRESIGKLRGRIHRYYGVPLIVTYHPAALLRNPSWKRPTWEDVQLARRLLDRAPGA